MPNPIIVGKELIDKTAFEIVQYFGYEQLTARSIANKIGCSTKPIYRIYKNMDELKCELLEETAKYLRSYISLYKKMNNPLLDCSLAYISFIRSEKKLFEFIISEENSKIMNSVYYKDEFYKLLSDECVSKNYSIEKLEEVAEQIIIYTYGLAMMVYINASNWPEDDVITHMRGFLKNVLTGLEKETL